MPTFDIISQIVNQHGLHEGFSQQNIIDNIPHNQNANGNTIRTFIWKHSIGGGEVKKIYFRKLRRGLYVILSNHGSNHDEVALYF
jgi:hypothetical protein